MEKQDLPEYLKSKHIRELLQNTWDKNNHDKNLNNINGIDVGHKLTRLMKKLSLKNSDKSNDETLNIAIRATWECDNNHGNMIDGDLNILVKRDYTKEDIIEKIMEIVDENEDNSIFWCEHCGKLIRKENLEVIEIIQFEDN